MTTALDPPPDGPLTDAGLRQILGGLLPVVLARRGDLLAVKDAANGRYAFVNDAMAEFLDLTPTGSHGRSDADFFDASLATALRAAVDALDEHARVAQPG